MKLDIVVISPRAEHELNTAVSRYWAKRVWNIAGKLDRGRVTVIRLAKEQELAA